MDEREWERRQRQDVCTNCGWSAVLIERHFECVNDRCEGYRKRRVIKKAMRQRRMAS